MEKKNKQIKLDNYTVMWGILGVLVVAIIGLIIALIAHNFMAGNGGGVSGKYRVESYNGRSYYVYEGSYEGDYNLQSGSFEQLVHSGDAEDRDAGKTMNLIGEFNTTKVMDYSEYTDYCNKWSLWQAYNDSGKNYIVIAYASVGSAYTDVRLADVATNGSTARVYMYDKLPGYIANSSYYALIIPVEKEITRVDIVDLVTEEEYQDIVDSGPTRRTTPSIDKPVIYLYPTAETEISVKLGHPELLTTVYPTYDDGWKVLAKPDGTLKDLSTGRELYSLYYESNYDGFERTDEGFVVKGEESASFLEEKLATLGLSEREMEEFIIYWLPKLESHPYNYIRFATAEEINAVMPLSLTPAPDNVIRILMIFEGLDRPTPVTAQSLATPNRAGFTVVEWGGTEIK